jgi:hypothetical protein
MKGMMPMRFWSVGVGSGVVLLPAGLAIPQYACCAHTIHEPVLEKDEP